MKFGSDPELFIFRDNNIIKTPWEFIAERGLKISRYYKDDPMYPIIFEGSRGLVHADGAAFELVVEPAESLLDVRNNALAIIDEFYRQFGEGLVAYPSGIVNLDVIPPEFLEYVVTIGCRPDKEAILDFNPTGQEVNLGDNRERYGGGHITFEVSPTVANGDLNILAQLLAIFAGVPFLVFTKSYYTDAEKKRASMYGTPAKYRDNKLHAGIFEYRTPSNAWLLYSPMEIEILERGIRTAVDYFYSHRVPSDFNSYIQVIKDNWRTWNKQSFYDMFVKALGEIQ